MLLNINTYNKQNINVINIIFILLKNSQICILIFLYILLYLFSVYL